MDDLALPQHHRSGAHRARRHPLLTVLASLAAVAVFSGVLLWALLALDVLGAGDRLDLPLAGSTSEPAPTADAEASVPPTAATTEATGTAEPSPVEPEASPEPSVEPSVEPSPEPTVDRTVAVTVLNSTTTPGLAAGAAEVLTGAGWAVEEVGNYGQGEIPTTVLFPAEDLSATAEAIATDLGAGAVELSDAVDVVTVVLGPDYPG